VILRSRGWFPGFSEHSVLRCTTVPADFAGTLANEHCYSASTINAGETHMPLLIPVLVGIPVIFGGGYIIYHLVQ
jgi:hypothetical protein